MIVNFLFILITRTVFRFSFHSCLLSSFFFMLLLLLLSMPLPKVHWKKNKICIKLIATNIMNWKYSIIILPSAILRESLSHWLPLRILFLEFFVMFFASRWTTLQVCSHNHCYNYPYFKFQNVNWSIEWMIDINVPLECVFLHGWNDKEIAMNLRHLLFMIFSFVYVSFWNRESNNCDT